MIKAIFFDLGNVLVKEGFASGIREYEKNNSLAEGSLYRAMHDFPYWKDFSLGNISEDTYFSEVIKNFKGELDVEKLRKTIFKNFIQNVKLVEYIKALKKKYKIGIISNNPKEWFEYFFNSFGWDGIFNIVAVSGNLHIRKPAKEIFDYALAQAEISGEEAIYVDDRPDRVEGAILAGMKVLIFEETKSLIKNLDNIEVKS
ncbi:MAG: HAD family phosphatase [Candidatus Moranbacteria bacterium]|nr:HAD family phosphatase [Candidatus Moranbacteria bacterium]